MRLMDMCTRIPLLILSLSIGSWAQTCPVSKPGNEPKGWFGGPGLRVAVTGNEWARLPRWDAPTIEMMLGLGSGSLPWRGIPGWQAGYRNKVVWSWDGYDPQSDPTPPLLIAGHRLDGTAPPMLADTNAAGFNGNGSWTDTSVFIMSGVVFPTAGCWEISGTVRNRRLTFVVLVAP